VDKNILKQSKKTNNKYQKENDHFIEEITIAVVVRNSHSKHER